MAGFRGIALAVNMRGRDAVGHPDRLSMGGGRANPEFSMAADHRIHLPELTMVLSVRFPPRDTFATKRCAR